VGIPGTSLSKSDEHRLSFQMNSPHLRHSFLNFFFECEYLGGGGIIPID